MISTLLLLFAFSSAPQLPEQQIRSVDLDPNVQIHQVDLYAYAGRLTMVQIPGDTFSDDNVLCGQCTVVESGDAASTSNDNWLLEKHAKEGFVVIRMRTLPTGDNPLEGFTTNVVIKLDGRHVVQIIAHVIRSSYRDEDGNPRKSDGVLTLNLPAEASMLGILGAKDRERRQRFNQEVELAAGKLYLERLQGARRCKDVGWPAKPFRKDGTVVTIRELCRSDGPKKTFWLTYDVENRSNGTLYVQDAQLSPEGTGTAVARLADDRVEALFDRRTLEFAEVAKGFTAKTLESGSTVPATWKLTVLMDSSGREHVEVEHLQF